MRIARFTALAFGIALIAASPVSAQSPLPKIEVQSRQGDFYWVVTTEAGGARHGGWVPAQIIDSMNVRAFPSIPPESVPAGQRAVSAPNDFDGIVLALQTMRDRIGAAATTLEGLPESAVLRNRIDQIDQASRLVRQLAADDGLGRAPSVEAPRVVPQRVDTAQPPVRPPTISGVSRRPQTRGGFWFNAGMGIGSLGCDNCLRRENGLSGGLSLGGTIGERLLLGVGTSGWAKTIDGETLTIGTLDARLRFYPARKSGFFVTGGLGVGSISNVDETDSGLGLILGVGYDIRVGRNISLTPFYNGFAMRSSLRDANVGQLGIGITIH